MSWKYAPSQTQTTPNVDKRTWGLSGERWLLVGRIGWLVAAAVVLAVYVVNVPRDWNLVHRPCAAGEPCHRAGLTPADIQTLARYGIELEVYAITHFVLRLLTALLYLVIAGLIFWRKSHDALALFGAYMLLTRGLTTTSFAFAGGVPAPEWRILFQVVGVVSETILTFFLALFPTKTFVPLAMRWIAPALAAVNLSLYFVGPTEPYVLCGCARWEAPRSTAIGVSPTPFSASKPDGSCSASRLASASARRCWS